MEDIGFYKISANDPFADRLAEYCKETKTVEGLKLAGVISPYRLKGYEAVFALRIDQKIVGFFSFLPNDQNVLYVLDNIYIEEEYDSTEVRERIYSYVANYVEKTNLSKYLIKRKEYELVKVKKESEKKYRMPTEKDEMILSYSSAVLLVLSLAAFRFGEALLIFGRYAFEMSAFLFVASVVTMIITRVKYPKNIIGLIVMILCIIIFVCFVISIILLIVFCNMVITSLSSCG